MPSGETTNRRRHCKPRRAVLWFNKLPPVAALREAQLTIYRHPERIPALAGERGKPDFAKTVELKAEPAAPARVAANRTPTKLWAAFVLSGVGR